VAVGRLVILAAPERVICDLRPEAGQRGIGPGCCGADNFRAGSVGTSSGQRERPGLTGGGACGHARWIDERVVVIGAGPAGLAAAWEIHRAGLERMVVA
jgi:NADPH-dependent 2,4-dienoyl-CoA reductase/sulfur reductase-like enzyme